MLFQVSGKILVTDVNPSSSASGKRSADGQRWTSLKPSRSAYSTRKASPPKAPSFPAVPFTAARFIFFKLLNKVICFNLIS
jgi:hypothetical protein